MQESLINEIRERVVNQLIEQSPWIAEEKIEIEASNFQEWSLGLGPFSKVIENENFTDLFINGRNGAWINRGNIPEPYEFSYSESALINFVRSHALRAGKQFDPAHPAIDLELGRGIRLHAILPPIIEDGLHLSLRLNQARSQINWPETQLKMLDLIIRSRKNFFISGGTGSGKTTLLSQMIVRMPRHERILVIEDTHEIQAEHQHLLRLQARECNNEGFGEVPIRELIRQALRMRPDRIFLGEVRGDDILDLFLALNTGHSGSGGTIHANSAREIPNRVTALAMTSGITREAALALCASAIELIIHLESRGMGSRISTISMLKKVESEIVVKDILKIENDIADNHLKILEECLEI